MKCFQVCLIGALPLVVGVGATAVGADEQPELAGRWEVTRFDAATADKFAGFTLELESDGTALRGTAVWEDGRRTPIAAGRIDGSRVSFKVTPGSVIQEYGGELQGDIIRGRWAVGIGVFDWEARRCAAHVTAKELHGRWRFEHGALGEFDTLDLQADGRFVLEHRDVALGTTTTSGTWALAAGDVVLRAERREMEGKEISDGTPLTEILGIKRTGAGLRLGSPPREFRQEPARHEPAENTPPAAAAERPRTIEREFAGESANRSLEEALAEALRTMDRAVAEQGRYPCTKVSWRLVEIRGMSGTPADLQTLQVKVTATFEPDDRQRPAP